MKKLSFQINNFQIDYDFEYGIDKQTGWSCCIDGSWYSQFHKTLIGAVFTAIYKHIKNYEFSKIS